MLELTDINLWFNKIHVIRDLSFRVNLGEIICLLGPSGCGKSTILRLISGLEKPKSGKIVLADEVISSSNIILEPHRRNIGFLFQDFALFPHLTVAQNIGWGLSGFSRKNTLIRTNEMLESIRMTEHAKKYPHELSGGEQQRVALARARAPEPGLILLDEPFSGLDTALRGLIRDETNNLLREQGATVVMVTHDPDEAMLMADRIILMKEGQVIQIGSPSEIYSSPVDSFSASFFGQINHFSGTVEGNRVKSVAGFFPNKNYENGRDIDIFIRPDSISLGALDRNSAIHHQAYVCSVKYTGKSSYIRIAFDRAADSKSHIVVREKGYFRTTIGEKLYLNINKNDIFMFPKNMN